MTGIEQAERDAIIAVLKEAGGDRLQAAKALGLARSSLYRKLKQFGITTLRQRRRRRALSRGAHGWLRAT